MSGKYIVWQPIKDAAGNIMGNEILYHGANQAFSSDSSTSSAEFAAANTIYSFLTQNTPKVLKGTLNFMTFTTMLLMKKTPRLFDKSDLVIQIDDAVIIHPLSMHLVQQYVREGYRVAVNEFQFTPRYLSLLDDIHFIKINGKTSTEVTIRNTVEIAHSMNKKCIVSNIEDEAGYQRAVNMGADALEGSYVAERVTTAVHNSAYLQSSFFQLMVAVTRDEPDVDEIEQIISMDAMLTYSLLKIVNSAYFALRNRATNVHQAVTILGLGQLRQWIYLMGCSNEKGELDESQEEMLKLSFTRASFASELMRFAKNMPINRNDAYLMGMFSTLPFLIAAPLEDILAEVAISEHVKAALLSHEGRGGMLYDLLLAYERADWTAINRLGEELGLPMERLPEIYFQCLDEVNHIWQQLMDTGASAGEA